MSSHPSPLKPFKRLAVVLSHPTQYYSPWFRFLAMKGLRNHEITRPLDLRVFYLWDGGVTSQVDKGFRVSVKWDVPLLGGYEHVFVPNRAKQAGTHSVWGVNNPELAKHLEAFQPEAILVFGYNYLSHYRLIFSRLARTVPLLFRGDSHRLYSAGGPKAWLKRMWISRVMKQFSAFLYVGQANREYFRYHGVVERQLFFCPHCVDNERFFSESEEAAQAAADWKRELGIDPQCKVILFAGKFEPKKRPLDLIAAFKRAKLPGVNLVLIGNGVLEPELRREAAGRSDIFLAPFQNQSLMPRTYMLGNLFVLPSLGGGETWGLAVNEAMCMGRPIIVSDHVGCAQDLVHPNRNGLIFPAGDVGALTAALREAFSDGDRLRAWGEASREIVKEYSYERAAQGLQRALEFLAARSGPA